ncbi:phosphatase [Devosia sp. Leaf420]|uniref:inositol monophosphatase family protein n=1 Tax=Devosia sp. Leaf420 TaxID=1736374 RepID=UPI000712A890|nr:inositol monophosphatase [Devosia sp. Leaf420]KQT51510.1 phosphatase [Devosia sp. Leaf420]
MTEISDDLLKTLMADMRTVAEQEILPRFQAITSDSMRAKTAPDDLVTDADISAEHALNRLLVERLPGVVVVGEEAVSEDRSVLEGIGASGLVAIIDPVDGTWNFAHGAPTFGSILAIVEEGKTIAGIIHYPVLGDFIVARPGQGAWHVAADGAASRLSVAKPRPVSDLNGFVPLHMFAPELQLELAQRVLRFSRTTTWGCSAWEYRMLATGAMSFCLNASVMPWDHAAGVLIHAEAGGHAAFVSGEPYSAAQNKGFLLTATDAESWTHIRDILFA